MKNSTFIASLIGLLIYSLMTACSGSTKQASQKKSETKTIDTHNSQSSLDWEGSYHGVLPCADCEGIATTITLNKNNSFSFSQKYLGKSSEPINESGPFSWTNDGNKIVLKKVAGNLMFQVGENQLFWLDKEGKRITGDLANHYKLAKIQNHVIIEKYWKLISVQGKAIKEFGNKEPHIILKQDNNKLIGNGGCNSLMGSYEIGTQNKIRFTNIVSTEMACNTLKTEQEFLNVLHIADSYIVKEDTLFLYNGSMAPLARLQTVYLH